MRLTFASSGGQGIFKHQVPGHVPAGKLVKSRPILDHIRFNPDQMTSPTQRDTAQSPNSLPAGTLELPGAGDANEKRIIGCLWPKFSKVN